MRTVLRNIALAKRAYARECGPSHVSHVEAGELVDHLLQAGFLRRAAEASLGER